LTWKPKLKVSRRFPLKFYILGFFSGGLSLLFGATGPLLAPFFLNEQLNRFQIIATKAFAQLTGHLTKVITFFVLGFSYGQYAGLILAMAVAVIAGTYLGKRILSRVDDKLFVVLFKGVITILCFRMIYIYFLES